ncbi:MAG: type II secretion system secretin GspD [Syntrophobacterales bacterium]|nr:MAG: type II secretion system secretin GspD [Syntrophobacterales bacterium]
MKTHWLRSRLWGLTIIFLLLLLIIVPSPWAQRGEERISIDFHEADIRAVIKFISELTGKNFVVDSKVKGKVTVISPTKITIEEAYRMFESILEVEGFTTVPAGKAIKIIPSREAKEKGIEAISPNRGAFWSGDRIITRIIHLKFIDGNSLLNVIKPLVSKESSLVSYPYTNDIILTDVASNIKKILTIIKELDVEGFQEELSVVPLEHADAKTMAAELKSIFEEKAKAPPTPRARRPAPGAAPAAGKRVIKIIPDERTNSIVLVASADDTTTIKKVIHDLDVPAPKGKGKINVYYLRNADAEEMAKVLTEIASKAIPSKDPKIGVKFAGEVVITPDKSTNSLVITASPQDYEVLKGVIEKLDIRRLQVFVEALIMEVSMEKARELGLEFRYSNVDYDKSFRDANMGIFGGTSFGDINQAMSNPFDLTGFVLGAADGTIAFGGNTFLNIAALIRALQTDSDVNILSTPHLLTMDNQEAEIVVARNVPFKVRTTATASGFPVEEIERKDVGLTLRLTPQISEGDFVRLEIYQELSNVLETPIAGATDLVTSKRSAKTTVVVKDHQPIVLGGLISDTMDESVKKVPFLGDIPLMGPLFKVSKHTGGKSNLLLIITPHIIRSARDLEGFYKEKKDEIEKFQEESKIRKRKKGGIDIDQYLENPASGGEDGAD